MSTFLLVAFVGLLFAEAAGLGTFLVLHLRSDWRSSDVGRHLAYYSGAFLAVYVTTLAAFFIRWQWLPLLILALHVPLAVVIWQRVWLVLRRR